MDGYVRNAWYMAGWEHELATGMLTRKICDIPMVLFRTESGAVKALHDWCSHRFAPLSRGKVKGEHLVCGYHGLEFNGDGHCAKSPFSPKPPPGSAIRSFKIVVRDSILWLWLGAQSEADESQIPDFALLADSETTRTVRGKLHWECNYQYIVDNVMDVSHIEWVHGASFGGRGIIEVGKHEVVEKNDEIWNNWSFFGLPRPPVPLYPVIPWDKVDMWIDTRWNAPNACLLVIGVTPHGEPREKGMVQNLLHVATPETQDSTHYFWAMPRNHLLHSASEDERIFAVMTSAFEKEDKPIVEAAAKNAEGREFWSLKPVFLSVDAGATRARRILERRAREEQGVAAAAE